MSLEPEPFSAPSAPSLPSLTGDQLSENVGVADVENTKGKILGHILENTEPAPLPAAWSFLPLTRRVRTLRCTTLELVTSLEESFSEEELRAARILVGDSEKELQLSPVLCGHTFQVVGGAEHQPIDLANDAGLLFGEQPPCFHFACQRLDGTDRPRRVFVAALRDLAVFACLGLRCTPAAGLASLNGQQLRLLYANLSRSSRPPRHRLTLVGASIADLEFELPSYIAPILHRLHDAQVIYELDENDDLFELWRPSAEELKHIHAAVTFSDRQIIRRAILASVNDPVLSVSDAWRRLHAPDENDLEFAHAAFRRAIAAPVPWRFGTDLRAATDQLRAAIEHVTTRRFIQAAATAATPQESQAHLLRAEIIQHLNQSYGLLGAAKSRDGSFHYDPTLSEERLAELERSTNLLLKVDRLSPQK